MKKIVCGAIGVMVLLFGGCRAAGDPIDNLAQALRAIVKPARGALGSEEEARAAADVFYTKYADFEARLDKLNKEWDKYDKMTDTQRAQVWERTKGTLELAGYDAATEVAQFVRDTAASLMGGDSIIAKLPMERVIDVCTLAINFFEEVTSERYRKSVIKLKWVSRCLPLSKARRAEAKTPQGEKICVTSGCLTKKECAAVLFNYIAEVLEPWNKCVNVGIDMYGRHIDGLGTIIGDLARTAGKTDTESNKLVEMFKKGANILRITVKSARSLQKAMMTMKASPSSTKGSK